MVVSLNSNSFNFTGDALRSIQIIENLKPTAVGEAIFYWRVGATINSNLNTSDKLEDAENKKLKEVLTKLTMEKNLWARKIFEAFLGWWIFENVVFPTYRRNFRQASNAILAATIYGVDTFSTRYTPAELHQLVRNTAEVEVQAQEEQNKRWNSTKIAAVKTK